jgi:hypothetical protein
MALRSEAADMRASRTRCARLARRGAKTLMAFRADGDAVMMKQMGRLTDNS